MFDIGWFITVAAVSFLVFSSVLWWSDWSEYWWPRLKGERRWKGKSLDGRTIYYRTDPNVERDDTPDGAGGEEE